MPMSYGAQVESEEKLVLSILPFYLSTGPRNYTQLILHVCPALCTPSHLTSPPPLNFLMNFPFHLFIFLYTNLYNASSCLVLGAFFFKQRTPPPTMTALFSLGLRVKSVHLLLCLLQMVYIHPRVQTGTDMYYMT